MLIATFNYNSNQKSQLHLFGQVGCPFIKKKHKKKRKIDHKKVKFHHLPTIFLGCNHRRLRARRLHYITD